MVEKLPMNLGNPLVFHAVVHSNVKDVITLLDDNEANVNAQNINGSTPLHCAVQTQNQIIVKILLDYGADPNIKEFYDVGQLTPLHMAVELSNFDICQQLLSAGANPSIQSKNGFTCLHIAAKNGNKEMIELLLASGVDVNLRDANGFNASFWAKSNKHVEILKLLPKPMSIQPKDYMEFDRQLREKHDITNSKKGKKKKKKKK